MKNLIIYAHPNPESLNHFFKKTVLESLEESEDHVILRDLNEINFNPVLSLEDMNGQRIGRVSEDVQIEQDFITWADRIIFIYPIWWTGMPAIMKGYIDRVFSYGFAYRYDLGVQKGLLSGKNTIIINSHGKSNAEYAESGLNKALALTSDTGIFNYVGLKVQQHFYFDKADSASAESISEWKNEIKAVFKSSHDLAPFE